MYHTSYMHHVRIQLPCRYYHMCMWEYYVCSVPTMVTVCSPSYYLFGELCSRLVGNWSLVDS